MHSIYWLLALVACGDHLESSTQALATGTDGGVVWPSTYEFCKTVTVSGKVLYNDLRASGRFSLRSGPSGTGAVNALGTGTDINYLGLYDARVDLSEIDIGYGQSAGCIPSRQLGSAIVRSDGTWSWHGEVCDNCNAESNEGDESLSIAASIVLEHCDDERCFRVAEPDSSASTNHFADDWSGSTRSRQYRGATSTAPKVIGTTATTLDLGTDYYQSSGSQTAGKASDLDAQAANVFAELVDVTRKVHTELNVPFDQPEVSAYFPGSETFTHSHEAGFLCIKNPGSDWIESDDATHEYGHLLHYPEWAHHGKWVSYCYDSDCDESTATQEYANAAFKEGWADFITAVTYDKTGSSKGCNEKETDAPLGCPVGQTCPTGRHYIKDVTQVLCDLWDGGTADCNGSSCDQLSVSLPNLVDALHDTWTEATPDQRDAYIHSSEHNVTTTALGICELAKALVASGPSKSVVAGALGASGLDCNL